jgi:tetratricopeptide (TPR) repeat protein
MAWRSLVGTAGYIAPEGPGTPQADLYALGKVLYEAAFGKDRQEFPALPADVASRPDHARLLELNAILLKACAADSRERYPSADRMRADLELLHAGRSVKRRQAWQRAWRHAKKLALAGTGLALVASIAYFRHTRPSSAESSRPPDFLWSTNEAANEELLKGVRSLQADGNNSQAIQYFQSAIQKDQNFAEAYARLAWAYYTAGGVTNALKGHAAAQKAVSLNPNLGYAHSVLASAKGDELKWAEADKERRMAVTLNPNCQEILLESALNLAVMGRTNEALLDLERARRADPGSASNLREHFYGFVYAWCRQYDRALEIYSQFPNKGNFHLRKGAITIVVKQE